MANNLAQEQLISSRSEILSSGHDHLDRKINCRSPLRASEPVRSSCRRARSASTTYCSCCRLPLLIDINEREASNKSRASAALTNERLCHECSQDRTRNIRTPSSRLLKSASVNWSHMGEKIGTWFEKAQTPDQRVVYNFLEQINDEQNKKAEKSADLTRAQSLNDVLNSLKKYQTRFRSPHPRNKLSRAFESSSWRVLRHPTAPYEFTQYNTLYGDEATRDMCVGSIFVPTKRRIRSTFLIHPNWI